MPVARRLQRIGILTILVVVGVVMLFPFVYMVLVSLRSPDQYLKGVGVSLDSWTALFNQLPVMQQMVNSTIVTVSSVALIVLTSTMAGFAL